MYPQYTLNQSKSPMNIYQQPFDLQPSFATTRQPVQVSSIQPQYSNPGLQISNNFGFTSPLSFNYSNYHTPQQIRYENANQNSSPSQIQNLPTSEHRRRNITTESNLYRSQILKVDSVLPDLYDMKKAFQERKSEKTPTEIKQPTTLSKFKSQQNEKLLTNLAKKDNDPQTIIQPIGSAKQVYEQIVLKQDDNLQLEKILQYENDIYKLKKSNIELNSQKEQYKMMHEQLMKEYTELKSSSKATEQDQTTQQDLLIELSTTNQQLQEIIKNQSSEINIQKEKYESLEKKMKEMLKNQEEMELLTTKKITIFENQLEIYLQQNESLTQQIEYYKQLAEEKE